MHRSGFPTLLAVAIVIVTTACGSSSSTPTIPTTPLNPITETFAGTLNLNGAATYPFTVTTPGTITATLTTVGPDPTVSLGLSIGTWSGTTCSVGSGLFQDQAVQGAVVVATVSAAGTLCLRVYDSGTLTAPATYSVDVVHP
jgi:hypothetical protein